MTTPACTLFDEASARLPLFDDLSQSAFDHLTAAGMGRRLLTATVRSRLRKAGFSDLGALALATPAGLTGVRKIGPVRLEAIRAHILAELARVDPQARAFHSPETTASRRIDRLRTVPIAHSVLEGRAIANLPGAGGDGATLARLGRRDVLKAQGVAAADLDAVVSALVLALLRDRPRPHRTPLVDGCDPIDDRAEDERAMMLRERDREWDEAAPKTGP